MTRIFAAALILCAAVAGAEPPDFEIFGGLGVWQSSLDALYDASYTPSRVAGIGQLFQEPDTRSRGMQSLALQGGAGPGIGAGFNVYLGSAIGLQFLFDRATIGVGGENTTHDVTILYDSVAFPAPDPVVRQAEFRFPSPATDGTLEETAVSFNGIVRIGSGRVASGSVSGGLSYLRFRAHGERIGALAAWLGGHAVLFSELYEASFVTDTAGAFGFNLGGQLDVALGPRVAVFADGRVFRAPGTEVPLRLGELLSDNIVTVPLGQVDRFLELPPLELEPSFVRFLFGLKVRF